MIDITYDRLKNLMRAELHKFNIFKKEDLPLTVKFVKNINGDEDWTSQLDSGTWCTWAGGANIYNARFFKKDGTEFMTWKFDPKVHGDIIEKTFIYFIENLGRRSTGLVIGSHDGNFGHWTLPVYQNKADAVLVDGSIDQFNKLVENYSNLDNVTFINDIVTTDGRNVEWMSGDEGYTDTINKEIILKHLQPDQITTTSRSSIAINKLIENNGGSFDWLHLDTEGSDADLIMALNIEPLLIILETMHLSKPTYMKLLDWFQDHNYKVFEYNGDAIAVKE